jgi:cell division protein ZapA (FtsZ GTPase activity inhibitor)
MTYQELNEQIAQIREVIQQKNKEMKEAENNAQLDKDLIN